MNECAGPDIRNSWLRRFVRKLLMVVTRAGMLPGFLLAGSLASIQYRPGRKQRRNVRLWGFAVLAAVAGTAMMLPGNGAAEPESFAIEPQIFPQNWRLQNVFTLPEDRLESMSTRLGGRVTQVKNYIVIAGRVKLQINVLRCASGADAEGVAARIRTVRKSDMVVQRRGVYAVEFVCDQPQVIKKAAQSLGVFDVSPRIWRVVMAVAPLQRIDYARWNDTYQALREYRLSGGARGEDNVRLATDSVEFGNQLTLRTASLPWGAVRYDFGKLPVAKRVEGEFTTFTIETMPRVLGIPQVWITAIIPGKPFSAYQPQTAVDRQRLTSATPHWPTENEQIRHAVKSLAGRAETDAQRAEMLLGWLHSRMRMRPDAVGTRVGVQTALQRHGGRCWDFSDVFVTLCRSAGIPSRQVAGWLRGEGGHIWTEVYLPEEGWVSVDPTTTWLGISDDYVPLFVSEDGSLPFVYWDAPRIEPAG